MPTIEEDLKTALTGIALYPDSVPNDVTYPVATYQQISDRQLRTHSGNALRRIRYQVTAFGETKNSTVTLANSIEAALDLNRTNFELATKENEISVKEPESGLYSIAIDFFVWTTK